MPTKKEVFLELMDLLKSNISEVDSRVYSAYPKKDIVLPFIEVGIESTVLPGT